MVAGVSPSGAQALYLNLTISACPPPVDDYELLTIWKPLTKRWRRAKSQSEDKLGEKIGPAALEYSKLRVFSEMSNTGTWKSAH